MPVPPEYQRATDDFYKLLTDVRDSAGLTTTNQAYTVLQGVFQVFRRRLDLKDAVRFLAPKKQSDSIPKERNST
jgi:uncharacterized protein (DUF2267 family)